MQRRKAATTRATSRQVPDALRLEVSQRAEDLLRRQFNPQVALERVQRGHGQFNYPIEVFPEWRGRYFYLCTKYRTPRGRPAGDFVVRATRLQYAGGGRFHLAYLRHTNRWCEVYSGLTVSECFETIEQEEVFWPIM